MKIIPTLLIAFLAGLSLAPAAEPTKSLVALSVRKQILDSNHELRGNQGNSEHKTVTLRVEIVNQSSTTIESSELSGTAIVMRAGDMHEKSVREPLGPIKLPVIKPNEKLTLDLGKIQLHKMEWRTRKFEETLDEWQVVCTQGKTEIGKAMSSDHFATLDKASTPPPAKPAAQAKKKHQAAE